MPGATSSVLVTSSDALVTSSDARSYLEERVSNSYNSVECEKIGDGHRSTRIHLVSEGTVAHLDILRSFNTRIVSRSFKITRRPSKDPPNATGCVFSCAWIPSAERNLWSSGRSQLCLVPEMKIPVAS